MSVDVDLVDVCVGVGVVSGLTNDECTEDSVAVELKGMGVLGNVVCVWSECPSVGECMDVLDGERGAGVGEFAAKDLCVGELSFNSV